MKVIAKEYENIVITLSCIYGPKQDNPTFYQNVVFPKMQLCSETSDFTIMGGDWNLVLDVNFDKKGGINRTNINAQTVVKNYMEETELVDIWRFHHPTDFKFTWYRINPTKISCRLDFFW